MPTEIRPARKGDIAGYHALLDAVAREERYLAMTEAPPLEQTTAFVRGIIARGDVMLLAVDNGSIVGWCDIVAEQRATTVHAGMLGMGLAASHRGRGLGGRLLSAAIEAARARGICRIQLYVYLHNERAQALYRRHGFVVEGTRRRVVKIAGSYLDDHVMALVD